MRSFLTETFRNTNRPQRIKAIRSYTTSRVSRITLRVRQRFYRCKAFGRCKHLALDTSEKADVLENSGNGVPCIPTDNTDLDWHEYLRRYRCNYLHEVDATWPCCVILQVALTILSRAIFHKFRQHSSRLFCQHRGFRKTSFLTDTEFVQLLCCLPKAVCVQVDSKSAASRSACR